MQKKKSNFWYWFFLVLFILSLVDLGSRAALKDTGLTSASSGIVATGIYFLFSLFGSDFATAITKVASGIFSFGIIWVIVFVSISRSKSHPKTQQVNQQASQPPQTPTAQKNANGKNGKKNALIALSIIIGIIVVTAIAVMFTNSKDVEKQLAEESAELNKKMPMQINDSVTATGTMVVDKSLSYYLKYTGSESLSQADLDGLSKDKLTKSVCTTPEMKALLDAGVGIVYRYYNEDGGYIGEISIGSSDCK